ncbi:unnamed protein product, partial [Pleuronectes platessa]
MFSSCILCAGLQLVSQLARVQEGWGMAVTAILETCSLTLLVGLTSQLRMSSFHIAFGSASFTSHSLCHLELPEPLKTEHRPRPNGIVIGGQVIVRVRGQKKTPADTYTIVDFLSTVLLVLIIAPMANREGGRKASNDHLLCHTLVTRSSHSDCSL